LRIQSFLHITREGKTDARTPQDRHTCRAQETVGPASEIQPE
jgi:hypothetical protein